MPCHNAGQLPGFEWPQVRQNSLRWIWYDSPAFNAYRGTDWMQEPCASCAHKHEDFGGCRCQAFLLTGDARATDPVCNKAPAHAQVVRVIQQAQQEEVPLRPMVFRRDAESQRIAESVPSPDVVTPQSAV